MSQEMEAKPNVEACVPLLGVSDIEASVRYYVDGLGFKMTRTWEPQGKLRWCWLEHGGAALMLQQFAKSGPGSPESKVGVGIGINFICKDALAIYHEVTGKGIEAKRPFVGNAMWVVSLTDPDGYKLFFESYTDAPEESEYTPEPSQTFNGGIGDVRE
jgi:catechol 2,3-dioxygenase-like lactoylglutathione lyase family enzyme